MSFGDKMIKLSDKGEYDKVNVLENSMDYDKKNFAINTTRYGLRHYTSHFDCAKYIKEQFDSKYTGIWVAILRVRGYGSCYYSYSDNGHICFTMGEFIVDIFRK
ncbi:hypothetical protein M9Y10_036789 [Tritrichomonas musculus]|uniref:Dynein light chain n=1 Tax=Tritrichomonas musculus TaxID=1915356 RepID=A0ABR2GU08_9EUKA